MSKLDQFIQLGIAIYADYKRRGLDDSEAKQKALQEVQEVSQGYRLARQ